MVFLHNGRTRQRVPNNLQSTNLTPPPRTYTNILTSLILPLLEASAEGFFGNLSALLCCIILCVLTVIKRVPYGPSFRKEEPKVTRKEVRWMRRLCDDSNALPSVKLVYNKRCVAGCVFFTPILLTVPTTSRAASPELCHATSVYVERTISQ